MRSAKAARTNGAPSPNGLSDLRLLKTTSRFVVALLVKKITETRNITGMMAATEIMPRKVFAAVSDRPFNKTS
ncbi:hypothetical protein AOE01nite_02580 [Acetobacter oeni]|uniref:Uncharacterized protein n=1 Tax=Acetobacter oeni TaxID=304077 RepID=A0A511XGF7_9PROT|nr:hypothetical protein AA21952_0623 [Acetobacter oeni LMG 21952]GEN62034.1 hypothetical protein AOE01nite_02580 [Acetobacter oeni]